MTAKLPVKIVYVTDHDFLRPTLVSVWSLLRALRGPAELHIWGDGLTPQDWKDVERITATNPNVRLHALDIGSGYLEGAYGPKDYISAATMGRLFIPGKIDGHVLYVDGDTLVTGDVSALFALDLGDAYAGVVRDFTAIHWMADTTAAPAERDARLEEIRQMMMPARPQDYFNAGILLMNCDAIRADADLLARIEDVAAASRCSHGDQDHLNDLFGGNVRFLDIAWNLSWGRKKRHRAYFKALGVAETGLLAQSTGIVHYHGPQKPWRKPRYDIWSSRGRATWRYRRELARYLRAFPDLTPR